MLPTLDDHRLKFRTLVAMNALGIARRELKSDGPGPERERGCASWPTASRAGEVPAGTHALLKEHVAAKLRVSNPQYLERYE